MSILRRIELSLATSRDVPSPIDAYSSKLNTLLRMHPTYTFGEWRLGQVRVVARQYDAAVHTLERAAERSRRAPAVVGLLAMAYAGQGNRAAAERLAVELTEASRARNTVPASALVLAYIAVGEKARAVDALEQAYAAHENYCIYMTVDPLMDPLRDDVRFQALCRRVMVGAGARKAGTE